MDNFTSSQNLIISILSHNLKRVKPTFLGTAVIATVVVGVIALGVWFSRALLERYLSTPHTFSGVTVTPYGHKMESLLEHSFDSLQISKDGTEITIVKPNLDITLLGENRGVELDVEKVDALIQLSNESKPSKDTATPEFPESLRIPAKVKLDVQEANIKLSNGNGWKAKHIVIKNNGEQAVGVGISSVEGDYLHSAAAINVSGNFEGAKLTLDARIKTDKDSVHVKANVPKKNLTRVKTKANISVKNPADWLPVQLPPDIPAIGKLDVAAEATIDGKTGSLFYNTTVKTHVGALWPLEPEDITINLKGNQENVEADILLQNNEGGSIHLMGNFNKDLTGEFTGRVDGMSAMFGPQMMPMDLEIQSATYKDKILNATIETRQGSIVKGYLDFNDSLFISFIGDISPYEPWALDWTHGNLILGGRPQLYGTCDAHKLRILAKFDTVAYAYHMTADSMQVTLALDTKGIDFTNGIIYTPSETFDFDGDVKWKSDRPHTSWNVTQRNGGKASAYIDIGDSIAIDVLADSTVVATIPFADIKLSDRIKGRVTGQWHQNIDEDVGFAEVSIEGKVDEYNMLADINARQNKDTIFIDKAHSIYNKNEVHASGSFILPNDSNPEFKPTAFLPIQVLEASIASKDFSIPLLLEPLGDTTFASGLLSGQLTFDQEIGLMGNLDFANIEFRTISPNLLKIKKLNIFAERDKVELNSYLDIGRGGWTGNTQIIIDNIFDQKRHLSFSHGSDNGGTIWAEGFFDNNFIFQGTADANGSWYIPGTISEITNTDLHIDITADVRKGINGITADIRTDSTLYHPPKMNIVFPIYMRGRLENGLLDLSTIQTKNDSNETITGSLQYQLDSLQLKAIDVQSERYTIAMDQHRLVFENISAHMEDGEDALDISASIPKISYKFNDNVFGNAEAFARGDIIYSIPHSKEGQIRNNTISGNILIDKMVYYRDFDIEVTPSALDKYITMFNNGIAKLRKKGTQEEKLSTASPVNLSLHISDSQRDSIGLVTPFATFPFTIDVWVLGNTTRPLLRGDIANTNSGFIGVKEVYEFGLNSFQISWNDVPWQKGVIDVSSSQELPYCSETEDNLNETCPINLDIQGTITNPQPIPSSNCGTESSSAAIYYNVLLGCIAEEGDETTDWNRIAGKAIGKVISTTANKTLGGDYIGDIDMKVMLFENTTTSDKDSSYFKIPVSLDRWVKNLSLVFGYTQDQSENPTYDQSLQFGVNYTLPVFQEAEYSHKNHISPTLSLNALLTSKQYLTNTGTEGNENRLEKNIGVNYIYRYWNPCLLGIGHCESIGNTQSDEPNQKETLK